MICHVVLIRLRSDADAEKIASFLPRARAVLGAIPGVENLRVGKAMRDDSPYPYCLVMDFRDAAALEAYQVHENHQLFLKEILGPMVEDKKVHDYEC